MKKSNFFNAISLPSFMRDWILKKFEDEEGNFDTDQVARFVKTYLPKKEDWNSIKNRVVIEGERVKFLAKVSVDINIKTSEVSFALPDFGLSFKDTIIEEAVWQECKEDLIGHHETWGMVELGYRAPDDFDWAFEYEKKSSKQKDGKQGKIKLVSFKTFCPYQIDLEYYKDARNEFSIDEWIDVLLGAVDYNAAGYGDDEEKKLTMLTRLLPFVEKRLNLIELAPKGTGKSYLYGRVSRFGWLSNGGVMSRAKMFYDQSRHSEGLVAGNDFITLDEVQTISFTDVDEMRAALKGYLESGIYTVGNHEGMADAGMILCGNISKEIMDADGYSNMFEELPRVFHESALIDRFHGFISGCDILPYANGGGQEKGYRAGTENIPGIVCMATALKNNCKNLRENQDAIKRLEKRLLNQLIDLKIRFIRNGSSETLPGLISLSFPSLEGETILHRLDLMGICVSTGAACNSKKTIVSHVLQAINVKESLAKGTIRISLGKDNTEEEVDMIVHCLAKILL